MWKSLQGICSDSVLRRHDNRDSKLSAILQQRFATFTTIAVVVFVLLAGIQFDSVNSCNEAVCASIVSKCTLIQSCKCAEGNYTCSKDCFNCLNYLYSECCSCVELCPKPNASLHAAVHSQVGDFNNVEEKPMPELFAILTDEIDAEGRWTTLTFPIDIDPDWIDFKSDHAAEPIRVISSENKNLAAAAAASKPKLTVNCTVAYMAKCMPLSKCRNSCLSMGSTFYRWFHDGCCECVAQTCIRYGVDESRCSNCSMDDDEDDEKIEGYGTEQQLEFETPGANED